MRIVRDHDYDTDDAVGDYMRTVRLMNAYSERTEKRRSRLLSAVAGRAFRLIVISAVAYLIALAFEMRHPYIFTISAFLGAIVSQLWTWLREGTCK